MAEPEPQGKQPCCMKFINYFMCHSNSPDAPKKTFGRKCLDCIKPAVDEPVVEGQAPQREKWGNRCQFFLSTLGMSVGLGSVWRFPTLAYKMGGAAFLIMYGVMVFFLGNALFFFEVSNGQYTSKNPLRVYDKVPIFQGVGIAMIAYAYLFCTYYNHMVSFSFYYLFSCFRNPLPWTYCPDEVNSHEDSVQCTPFPGKLDPQLQGIVCGDGSFILNRTLFCKNKKYAKEQLKKCCVLITGNKNISATSPQCKRHVTESTICAPQEYPSSYFWSHSVMRMYREDDPKFGYLGEVSGPLIGTSFLAWLICYIGLYKGLKSLGVMMYIVVPLPYIILLVMLIAAATQEGAVSGLKELFVPKFRSFIDLDVWRTATEQAFYSVGVSMGPIITFGSYQKFDSPSHIDGTLICLCIVLTGILCSLVVFSVLGFLSVKTGRAFANVVEAGPGLVFIVYPESLNLLPGSPFFAFLFYLMLINLGASSVTGIIETVSSACYDIWPKTRRYKYVVNLFVTLSCFLIGISFTARGGLAVYNAFDTYAAGMTLIPLCTLELMLVIYIYGIGRFCEDISFMIGFYPNRYYRYQWMLGPPFLLAIFIYGLVKFQPPGDWRIWTHVVSWGLFFLIIGWVPLIMIVQLIRYGKRKDLKNVFKPPPDHGPSRPEDKEARQAYSVRRRIF